MVWPTISINIIASPSTFLIPWTDRGGPPPPLNPPHRFRLRRYGRRIFSWGGAVLNHVKKFARRANFLKWCRGGVWGALPPSGISVTRALPPGEVWGAWPPGNLRSLPVPCLRSGRALPPCLAPNFFSSENFFDRKVFRPKKFSAEKFFGRKSFRPKKFSSEFFSSVRRFRFLKY